MRRSISSDSRSALATRLLRDCLAAGSVSLMVTAWGCAPVSSPSPSSDATPPLSVSVATVEERLVTLNQTWVGTVAPVRTSTVGSPADGRVVACLIEEGDYVESRQRPQARPLAQLRTEPLEINLASAQAELQVLEHKLREWKLSAPKEMEQARARKEAAETQWNRTRWRLEHTEELHKRGATSEDELEERRAAAQTAEQTYLEYKAAWELATSGLWTEKVQQAEADVEAQKQNIERLKDDLAQCDVFAPFDGYVTRKLAEVGQWVAQGDPIAEVVEIADVYVEVAVPEAHVSELHQPALLFHAPAECLAELNRGELPNAIRQELEKRGILFSASSRGAEATEGSHIAVTTEKEGRRWQIGWHSDGEMAGGEQPLCTIVRSDTLGVYRSGTMGKVEIEALPGRVFPGEVVAVVPKADVHSRCFPVKLRLANRPNPADSRDLLLKPGMFARVTLAVEKKARLVVPKDSLVLGEGTPTVWVVEPESGDIILGPARTKRVPVDVDLSATNQQWIEITGPVDANDSLPLKPGDLVVVEGNERLVPGRPVNVVKRWP